MPRKKMQFKFEDYIRVAPPNIAVIAELVKRAKGIKTLSEFAKMCDVSLPMMSIIVNEKITKPLSDAMIKAIVDNADPESGVNLETLLEANGMAKKVTEIKEDAEIEYQDTRIYSPRVRFGEMFEKTAKELISTALLSNGYTLKQTTAPSRLKGPFSLCVPDFEFETNALSEYGIDKWCFDTLLTNGVRDWKKLYEKFALVFSASYLEPLRKKSIKYSLVIDNREVFSNIQEFFKDTKISDIISVILIDIVNRKIVDEYVFPTEYNEAFKNALLN